MFGIVPYLMTGMTNQISNMSFAVFSANKLITNKLIGGLMFSVVAQCKLQNDVKDTISLKWQKELNKTKTW